MTITSKFYDGPVTGDDWAAGQPGLGDEYFVADSNAWRVRSKTSATRTVEVLTGIIGGHGVKDTNDAIIAVPLAAPTSGSRWYTIAAERNWTLATPATTVVALTGTGTKAIASSRQTNPGTGIDHQPLALVQITAGQALPTAIVDLRAIGYGGGFYLAHDAMVMDYMSKPGYRFLIDGIEWVILLDGSRLQSPNLPPYGINTDNAPDFTGSATLTKYLFGVNIPVKGYPRMGQFQGALNVSVPAGAGWSLNVRLADQGSPVDKDQGSMLVSIPLVSGSVDMRHGPTPVVQFMIPAGDARVVRMWLVKEYGSGAITIRNGGGITAQVTTLAVRTGNDW